MKRTAFKIKVPDTYVRPECKTTVHTKLAGVVRYPIFSNLVTRIPKENAQRSEAYRRLVAAMPCIHCGLEGSSQAAHSDNLKGLGIKSDDRTCFPLCCTQPLHIGCHTLIGMTGAYTKEQRRTMELEFGERTRAQIMAEGKWPKDLPLMIENNPTDSSTN